MDIEKPTITANAQMLLGYIAPGLKPSYKPVQIEPAECIMIVENAHTGNKFSIEVRQISGIE